MDKKSQHVGNHGGVYTDMDGQTKQFTYIDHDVKPKIGVTKAMEEFEVTELHKQIKKDRQALTDEILALPAVLCPYIYEDFTNRGEGLPSVEWNKNMIIDEGVDVVQLMFIKNMINNRIELERLIF